MIEIDDSGWMALVDHRDVAEVDQNVVGRSVIVEVVNRIDVAVVVDRISMEDGH